MLRRRLNAVFTRQTGGAVGPVSTLQSGRVKILLPYISDIPTNKPPAKRAFTASTYIVRLNTFDYRTYRISWSIRTRRDALT